MITRILLVGAVIAGGCSSPAGRDAGPTCPAAAPHHVPAYPVAVDLLLVNGNEHSTASKRDNLIRNFPTFLQELRIRASGVPDLRIGVTTANLGTGSYNLCEPGGEGAKLQREPGARSVPGCPTPADPWIAYTPGAQGGATNVQGSTSTDPIEQVAQAFACIEHLHESPCGVLMLLEAARRALDPDRNINPGFLRARSLLVVLFLADGDDCSAQDASLFDPSNAALGAPSHFRCVEHGLVCDEPLHEPGDKHRCRPGGKYLFPVEEYQRFFRQMRDDGRFLVAAIAAPPEPVKVFLDTTAVPGPEPMLEGSCSSAIGYGEPAVRLNEAVRGLGARGLFNAGLAPTGRTAGVCSEDYSPAWRALAQRISDELTAPCLRAWPVAETGEPVCRSAPLLADSGLDRCWHEARCAVRSGTTGPDIPRCPPALGQDCGAGCPCWRLRRDPACAVDGGAPFRVEVVRGALSAEPFSVECSAVPPSCVAAGD
jgi:hypothetical protein